jgi:hypothetical protein
VPEEVGRHPESLNTLSQKDSAQLTVKVLVETAWPEADVTVMSPGPRAALGGTVTISLVDVDCCEMVAFTPPMTTPRVPVRFLPLMVIVAPGAPLVGEKLVKAAAASPVQNRGSLAGDRKMAITDPLDSVSDSRQGAFIDILQWWRNVPFGCDPTAEQTFTPVVLGSLPTVSVTDNAAWAGKCVADKVETAVG